MTTGQPGMTAKDKDTLRGLNGAVRGLNALADQAREDGYEVTLRLEKAKAGHHRVRLHLHRRLGG